MIEPEHPLNETELHPVGIHHATHYIFGHKLVMFLVRKLSRDVLSLLSGWGVPDGRGALDAVIGRIRFSSRFAGKYGEWTEHGLLAKHVVQNGTLLGNVDHPKPWMCSCFTSKAFAAMIGFMESEAAEDGYGGTEEVGKEGECMFWCTKSAVQPMFDGRAAKSNLESMATEHEHAYNWLRLCHINREKDYLSTMKQV